MSSTAKMLAENGSLSGPQNQFSNIMGRNKKIGRRLTIFSKNVNCTMVNCQLYQENVMCIQAVISEAEKKSAPTLF